MKNIYNITKGQLISAWGFAILLTFWASDKDYYSTNPIYGLVGLGIPFLVIFYTIGWRNNRKSLK